MVRCPPKRVSTNHWVIAQSCGVSSCPIILGTLAQKLSVRRTIGQIVSTHVMIARVHKIDRGEKGIFSIRNKDRWNSTLCISITPKKKRIYKYNKIYTSRIFLHTELVNLRSVHDREARDRQESGAKKILLFSSNSRV